MLGLAHLFQTVILLFLGFLCLTLVINICAIRSLRTYAPPSTYPRLSVLIPARNEEENIARCVSSFLQQDYPNFEVLALDDSSTDQTWPILNGLAQTDNRLTIVPGRPLPAGWLGKPWACHQLSQLATGELLLFTDADVWFHPQTLSNAVAALQTQQADLLAALPHEILGSWAERLTIPLLNFAMLCVYPYPLAMRVRIPFLNNVNGQFMLFKREAYQQIGGFEAIRNHVVDDVMLGRAIKAHGLRWRLVNGSDRVFCRMYRNLAEVWHGFSKNLFPSFDCNLPLFLALLLGLALAFLEPLGARLLIWGGYGFNDMAGFVNLSILLALILAVLFCAWLRIPLYLALFYPVTVILTIVIGINSIYVALVGRGAWKGRTFSGRPNTG